MIIPDPDVAGFKEILGDLESSWDSAGGNSTTTTRTATVAGQRLLVRSPDEALLDFMWPALEHHPAIDGVEGLEVRIWRLLPGAPRPRIPPAAIQKNECTIFDDHGSVVGRLAFENARGVFAVWDRARRTAWWCASSIGAVPWWGRAAPFKSILAWWLADAGLHIAHASAVTADAGAVLVVGRSGSGKSTTAVTCHLNGMGYIGDDLCLVSLDPSPMVHSLYGTAKLFPHEFDHLAELHPYVMNKHLGAADKFVSVVARRPGASIAHAAPVRAVAATRVGHGAETVVEPASMGEVLTALAPSSLLPIPGTGGSTLHAMAEIVRHTPCYRITLGHDRSGVVAAIRSLVTTGTP